MDTSLTVRPAHPSGWTDAWKLLMARPPVGQGAGLVCIWLEADSEKRMQMQLVYLEVVPENTRRGMEK